MKFKYLIILFLILSLFGLNQCKNEEPGYVSDKAMVVSAREEASQIGVDILRKGGNAFDAMVATELALMVAYPYAQSIGGGGFMVYRKNDGSTGALDYREKAPLASTANMYLDTNGNIIENASTIGALSTAVPGGIAGIFEVYEKFGSMPLEELFTPAIELARRGVVVTEKQEKRIRKYQPYFEELGGDSGPFKHEWNAGDTIKYLALAKTLERILECGKYEFYQGETANILADFIKEQGGIISIEDLQKYAPKWRKPLSFGYDNLNVISMSPPSSGGICLGQIMQSLEAYDLKRLGHNSKSYIQLITEAERRAYADRSYYLADPDFVDVPVDTLLSDVYLKNRMQNFSFEEAGNSEQIGYGEISFEESTETTHYSIVDQYGNSVAATVTLNGAYGSKLYCADLGFFLNNEMDDFSVKPGIPNHYGLVGAEANKIEPEKRMLSSMTPTIIEKDGELFMVLGSPGGSTIITSVLQTILNVHEYGMGAQEAVSAARFHHQWLPDYILMEPDRFEEEIKAELKNLGYEIKEKRSKIIGKVDAILVLDNGQLEAGADPRGDDAAAGF